MSDGEVTLEIGPDGPKEPKGSKDGTGDKKKLDLIVNKLEVVGRSVEDLHSKSLKFTDIEKACRNSQKDILEILHDGLSGVAKETSRFEYRIEQELDGRFWKSLSHLVAATVIVAACVLTVQYLPGVIERQGLSQAEKIAITLFKNNQGEIQACINSYTAKGRKTPEACTINIY